MTFERYANLLHTASFDLRLPEGLNVNVKSVFGKRRNVCLHSESLNSQNKDEAINDYSIFMYEIQSIPESIQQILSNEHIRFYDSYSMYSLDLFD